VLRQFLYLNTNLVDEFLAQIEGGTYDDEEQTLVERTGKELGGRLRAGPLSGSAGRSRGGEQQTTRTLVRTPESAFAHLADYLCEVGELLEFDDLSDETWRDVKSSEIFELSGVVSVSSILKYARLAQQAGPLLSLFGSFGEDKVDPDTEAALNGFSLLGQLATTVPVVVRAAGAPRFKFIAALEPKKIRVELEELEGEATLFAKVQRTLASTERHTILDDLAGLANLPRDERRKIQRGLKNDASMPDAVISPPGAIVTPIAIFR